ncbi:MAG: DUF5723 family protein [Chitinophagaceae bacterium]
MKFFLILTLFVLSQTLSAQDFPGYRTGNYTGVNGVFFNPANIADSRYRWDVNLFSLNTSVGNNQASFKLKTIGETFKGDSIANQFIGNQPGASSGIVNATILGPSFMLNTDKKSAIAFTSRARVMMNATDIDGKLAGKIMDDFSENDPGLPYSINSDKNMRVSLNTWTEFGLSYARVIKDEGKHFLKGGITLKYLAGVANGYMNIASLKATINQDPLDFDAYLNNSSGRLELGIGGVNLADFDASKLTSFQSTGFGTDIGFVYEFRPDHEKYKLDNNDWRRNLNKYKFKIGMALLDIGTIKYDRDMQRSGAYDVHITGAEKLYLSQLSEVAADSLKSFFDNNPQYFTAATGGNNKNYQVGLPATLHIDADYHFHHGFYVNLSGQLSLVNTKNKPYNSQYYSSFSLVPRYEGRAFGIYLPVSYNKLTELNAGISLRSGPFFIGSGSILTAIMSHSKQADVYMGLRFGGLQKNKEKKENKKKKKADRKSAEEMDGK